MKRFALILLFAGCWNQASPASECDGFVAWVAAAKDAYQEKHRIYPVLKAVEDLALRYMPRLWVHPGSWQPIDFEDYLAISKLISKKDGKVIKYFLSARDLASLSYDEQCSTYLSAEEVNPRNPAPVYIQVFWDENPADSNIKWTYIKYNLVFDRSGLASKISWLSKIGTFLSGGDKSRWHRLDIHLAAILAFDPRSRLRMLTLAQHNHQQTYLPGLDFAALKISASR